MKHTTEKGRAKERAAEIIDALPFYLLVAIEIIAGIGSVWYVLYFAFKPSYLPAMAFCFLTLTLLCSHLIQARMIKDRGAIVEKK